jgi:predicted O-methyltransferase YrrM
VAVRLANQHPTSDPLIQRAIRAGYLGICGEMLQQPDEISHFLQWLAVTLPVWPAPIIMEIGSHTGASTCMWAEIASRQVIALDLPAGIGGGIPYDHSLVRDRQLQAKYPQVTSILGDSQLDSTVTVVRNLRRGPIDLLFIDGDHSMAGVTSDFRLYSNMVRPGGVVAFHDITGHADVREFFDALPNDKHRFQVAGSDWGGIGAIVA